VNGEVAASRIEISPLLDCFALANRAERPDGSWEIELRDMETGQVKARRLILPNWRPDSRKGVQFIAIGKFLELWEGARRGMYHHTICALCVQKGLERLPIEECITDISPDGRLAVIRDNGNTGRSWVATTDTGQKLFELLSDAVFAPDTLDRVFAPDSKRIVVSGIKTWPSPSPIAELYNRWFAKTTGGSSVSLSRMWDLETCEELATFDDDNDARYSPDTLYSPDSKTLATTHEDGTVRIWDVPPRKPVPAILGMSLVLWLSMLVAIRLCARGTKGRQAKK